MWSRSNRGFTLLELIVTMFVILLTMGLAVPMIGRSSDAIRARADVAGFSAVLRHARERAITSRQSHAVVIDPAARRITVLAGADGEVKETRAISERLTVQATPPPALTVRFEPEGTSSGGDYRVTAGSVVYRVTVDPITGRVKNTKL
jgi:prepilin-type N-terminal cleavage/methylation domain-containing protein